MANLKKTTPPLGGNNIRETPTTQAWESSRHVPVQTPNAALLELWHLNTGLGNTCHRIHCTDRHASLLRSPGPGSLVSQQIRPQHWSNYRQRRTAWPPLGQEERHRSDVVLHLKPKAGRRCWWGKHSRRMRLDIKHVERDVRSFSFVAMDEKRRTNAVRLRSGITMVDSATTNEP